MTELPSVCSVTLCVPGVSWLRVTGAVPPGVPSIVTRAPGGSLRTRSCPVRGAAFGSSIVCETVLPAVSVNGMMRGAPPVASSSLCAPAANSTVNGVTPRDWPSTLTETPGGLVLTTSVPGASAAAGRYQRVNDATPAVRRTRIAAAAAAHRRRPPDIEPLAPALTRASEVECERAGGDAGSAERATTGGVAGRDGVAGGGADIIAVVPGDGVTAGTTVGFNGATAVGAAAATAGGSDGAADTAATGDGRDGATAGAATIGGGAAAAGAATIGSGAAVVGVGATVLGWVLRAYSVMKDSSASNDATSGLAPSTRSRSAQASTADVKAGLAPS